MHTLKTYTTNNPLESKIHTQEGKIPEMLPKEIQHKLKLIEKAFR